MLALRTAGAEIKILQVRLDDVKSYDNLQLVARQLIEGFMTGLHKSPYHGFSAEYSEHRMYSYGEPIRHIDWKAYAKTEKFYVKRYEEESNLRVYFLMDTSASMYYPLPSCDKVRFSLWAAAALTHLFHRQRDAIGMFSFCERITHQLTAKNSGLHVRSVLGVFQQLLSLAPSSRKTMLSKTLHQVAQSIPRRSMLIVFTDLLQSGEKMQDLSPALARCRHHGHEMLLFHVMHDATEKYLQLDNRPYLFRPLEDGKPVRVNPMEVQQDYQARVAAHMARVQHLCGEAGACLLPADASEHFEQVFLACMMRRLAMR